MVSIFLESTRSPLTYCHPNKDIDDPAQLVAHVEATVTPTGHLTQSSFQIQERTQGLYGRLYPSRNDFMMPKIDYALRRSLVVT